MKDIELCWICTSNIFWPFQVLLKATCTSFGRMSNLGPVLACPGLSVKLIVQHPKLLRFHKLFKSQNHLNSKQALLACCFCFFSCVQTPTHVGFRRICSQSQLLPKGCCEDTLLSWWLTWVILCLWQDWNAVVSASPSGRWVAPGRNCLRDWLAIEKRVIDPLKFSATWRNTRRWVWFCDQALPVLAQLLANSSEVGALSNVWRPCLSWLVGTSKSAIFSKHSASRPTIAMRSSGSKYPKFQEKNSSGLLVRITNNPLTQLDRSND